MASSQVDDVITQVERNLIRDHIISASFDLLNKGLVNHKRRTVALILNGFIALLFVQSVVGFVADRGSWLHLYTCNAFYAYGFIGKVWNGIYALGVVGIMAHSLVIFVNEKKVKLGLITSLREMRGKLTNASVQEAASFAYYLKVMTHIREVALVSITVPMVIFKGIGAVITVYEFQAMRFLVPFLISLIVFGFTQQSTATIHGNTHLLIAQSTTYFKLRLRRVEIRLKELIALREMRVSQPANNAVGQKILKLMNQRLQDLQDILNEVHDHNESIKHWLRDELIITGCVLSYFLLTLLGDIEWYYKLSTMFSIMSWSSALIPSFFSSAALHTRILATAKVLHSCQTLLYVEARVRTAPLNRRFPNSMDIVKTKFRVIRLIHRVSSCFLKIGFTEGDGEEFSPASIGQFLSTVTFTTLMFLNSKSSIAKDLLSM